MGLVTLTFDHLTLKLGLRVASTVGNLPSKFWHARLLGSRIIRYVRDRRTDGHTDGQKQRLFAPSIRGRGIITAVNESGVAMTCL